MPVGYFEGTSFPRVDGKYRYEPYRGFGHLRMQEKLKSGERAIRYFDRDSERVMFIVEKWIDRELQISGLSATTS
jgi:hypothetical protein